MSDIDILDKDGNKTGQVLDFHKTHDLSLWHKSVWVWLYDDDGRILFQLRSKGMRHFPGLWAGSAAGHVDAGCTSLEAAMQEASEEIGFVASLERFELVMQHKKVEDTAEPNIKHKEYVDTYLVKASIDEIGVLQEKEVTEIRWFGLEELETELAINYEKFIPIKEHYLKIIDLVRKKINS